MAGTHCSCYRNNPMSTTNIPSITISRETLGKSSSPPAWSHPHAGNHPTDPRALGPAPRGTHRGPPGAAKPQEYSWPSSSPEALPVIGLHLMLFLAIPEAGNVLAHRAKAGMVGSDHGLDSGTPATATKSPGLSRP